MKKEEVITKAEELCTLCEEKAAETLVKEALSGSPDDPNLQTELAIIQSRLGYDGKAETLLRRVIRSNPNLERAVSALGNLLNNSLRTDEASSLYRTFLQSNPHGHVVLDDLCRLLIDDGDEKEALRLARKHAIDYPSEPQAYDALRYVLDRLEDDLADEVAENPSSSSHLRDFASNIIEQYSVLKKMEAQALEPGVDFEDFIQDIHEDLIRIYGEMDDIASRNERNESPLPREVINAINEALASRE